MKVLADAPDFDLPNIDGTRLTSADLKGKVVVVDFWATWCIPCKTEIPEYNKMVDGLKAKNVELIGISMDEQSGTTKDVAPFAKEYEIKYPIAIGTDQMEADFGGFPGLPTTLIIGKDWKVYRKFFGATPTKMRDIEKDVDTLLALE